MFKHLIIILLLLSCIAYPVVAANSTCPTCPTCPPEKVVYVTVTVPVPVPVQQQPTMVKPTVTPEPSLVEYLTTTPELLIYGLLFLILIIGIILMWRKNRKGGKPPAPVDELNLFEDEPPKKYVETPVKPEVKSKVFVKLPPKTETPKEPQQEDKKQIIKPKKPKSLLEQDFEF